MTKETPNREVRESPGFSRGENVNESAEATYITLANGKVAGTREIDDWTYVDVDENGRALGIEVIHPVPMWPLTEVIRRQGFLGSLG